VSDAAASGAQDERLTGKSRNGATPAIALAKRLGLRHVTTDALSIRRRRCGRGWAYIRDDGRPIQDVRDVRRLARLAVPPAYRDVLYAADPAAHLQAIGRDAAGRLQYRYHPEWDHVRELRKARRLARLADALPQVRRSGRAWKLPCPSRKLELPDGAPNGADAPKNAIEQCHDRHDVNSVADHVAGSALAFRASGHIVHP
jgi:hypothetical protein